MTVSRLLVLGIGMGPQHVTPEVAAALRSCDYVIAARKGDHDGLLAVRRLIAGSFGLPVAEVDDPPRDRPASAADYPAAVAGWHTARVSAYEAVLRSRGGVAAFLVWGDPSLYDSTIRVVSALAARLDCDWDVLPGVSAPQLLAARHRIVLHDVGEPVHITTVRRLKEAVDAGQDTIVVMLGNVSDVLDDLDVLGGWSLWWGANLGTPSEELVAGRVADVRVSLAEARERAKASAGWVLDISLLRRGSGS